MWKKSQLSPGNRTQDPGFNRQCSSHWVITTHDFQDPPVPTEIFFTFYLWFSLDPFKFQSSFYEGSELDNCNNNNNNNNIIIICILSVTMVCVFINNSRVNRVGKALSLPEWSSTCSINSWNKNGQKKIAPCWTLSRDPVTLYRVVTHIYHHTIQT